MADVLATMPKRIKVGSFTYSVRLVAPGHPELETNNGGQAWGMTDLDANRIYLDRTMTLDRLVNTFWHELTHAIHAEYGVKDGQREEHVTTQGANGWAQVNLDNPRLELWFHRAWQALRKTR